MGSGERTAPKSTYWGPAMDETEYAVFHFDVKTMSMRDAQGEYLTSGNEAPLMFETLVTAQEYCQQKILTTPTLGCRIYDHSGQVVQTFSDEQIYDQHYGLPAAKRNLAMGSACLIVGVGGVALDAWLHWRLTLGVLLGIRFLWVGTVRMMDGIAGWRAEGPARPDAT
jgi:hypothetical protein